MKLKPVLFVLFAVSAAFAALMGYLNYSQRQDTFSGSGYSSAAGAETSAAAASLRSSPAVSKKGGSLMIAYSGDISGRVDPCPCTQPTMGGFARRAAALHDFKKTVPGKPFLLLETGSEFTQGDELGDPSNLIVLDAFKHLGVQAVNAIPGDLRRLMALQKLGKLPGAGLPEFVNTQLEPAAGVAVPARPFALSKVRFEAENRDLQIGVLALSKSALEVSDLGREISENDAIKKWLPEIEPKSDLVVLLTRMKPEEAIALARSFPSIDVIINGNPLSEGRDLGRAGNTVLVESAHLGISLGILELTWDSSGKITKSANQLIPLPPNVKPDPEMAQVLERSKQEMVAYRESVARSASGARPIVDFPSADACKKCHEKAYAAWQKSSHSRSFEGLKKGGNQFNDDCLVCHVTVYRAERGYVDYVRTPELAMVNCIACHIYSVEHGRNPNGTGFGRSPGSHKTKVTEQWCRRCHDAEQSPDFKYDEYWKRIAH